MIDTALAVVTICVETNTLTAFMLSVDCILIGCTVLLVCDVVVVCGLCGLTVEHLLVIQKSQV